MTRDAELLAQGRQQRAVVGELALGAQEVDIRYRADAARDADQTQILLVVGEDFLDGLDLAMHGGDGDRLVDHRSGEHEIGAVELIFLELGKRLLILDLPLDAAEDIEGVADTRPQREGREGRLSDGRPEESRAVFLLGHARREIDLRKERSRGREDLLLGLRQRRCRGGEAAIVRDRLLHHPIEIRGLVLPPPFRRRLLSGRHPLLDLSGVGGRELRATLGRVLSDGRSRRSHEIRPDRAGDQEPARRDRDPSSQNTAHLHNGSPLEVEICRDDTATEPGCARKLRVSIRARGMGAGKAGFA